LCFRKAAGMGDGHFALPPGPALGIDLRLEQISLRPCRRRPDISLFAENSRFRRISGASP
jgi:hypothetical protein